MTKVSIHKKLAVILALSLIPWQAHAIVTNTNTQTVTGYGTGSTTNYTISFDFRDNSQIVVKLTDTSVSPASVATVPYGAGAGKFTITGGNPGTTVVMGTAPTIYQYLTISRNIPLTQPVAFDPASAIPISDLSTQLDLVTLELQNLNSQSGGATVTGPSGGVSIPTGSAYSLLGWDSTGNTMINVPGSGVSLVSGDVLQFNGSSWQPILLNSSSLIGIINGGTTPMLPAVGGTGVSNNGLLTWGTHALTFNLAADSTLTLPASGTVVTGTTNTANSSNTIVVRDGSGNFASNQITANSFVGPITGAVTGNVTGNVSGTSLNVTGTVAIGHGGTGQTTQPAALTALTGTQTSGYYLRSDGTNSALDYIHAGDLPAIPRTKLTSGTANVALINDGSGNISEVPVGSAGNVLTSNGITWVSAAPSGGGGGGGAGIAYAADTGTANAYVVNPTTSITILSAGQAVSFKSANANTGASTLNVSGLGAKGLTNPAGGALTAGDILSGQIVTVVYDGTNFQLISPQGPASSANTTNALIKRDASGNFSAGTITATLSGNVTGTVTGHASLDLQASNNLSDVGSVSTAFNTLSPMTTLGDVIYGGASGAGTRLSGNTAATKKFMTQTGTGTVSAAPAWAVISAADLPLPTASTIGGVQSAAAASHQWINSISTSGVPALSQPAFSDISGTIASTQIPNPSASTLGGVQSAAPVSHQWINSISTSGVPALSQPAFSDLSGSPTIAQVNPVTGSTGSPTSITAAGGVTSTAAVPFQTQFVQGSGGAVTVTASPQISAGTVVGQIMYVIGASDTNTLTVADGTGLSLNGSRTLANNSALTLMWNGSVWSEIAWRQ